MAKFATRTKRAARKAMKFSQRAAKALASPWSACLQPVSEPEVKPNPCSCDLSPATCLAGLQSVHVAHQHFVAACPWPPAPHATYLTTFAVVQEQVKAPKPGKQTASFTVEVSAWAFTSQQSAPPPPSVPSLAKSPSAPTEEPEPSSTRTVDTPSFLAFGNLITATYAVLGLWAAQDFMGP